MKAWGGLLLAGLLACQSGASRMKPFPLLMLWAWESPQDLRSLPPGVGVAFLAAEYRLQGAAVRVQGRRNPLRVGPGTPLMAVARIETENPSLDETQRRVLRYRLLELVRLPGVQGFQIDFDARSSERGFYRSLLEELRRDLPPDMPLVMTALASWCLDDPWISSLPVDERVPMLFRMGREGDSVHRRLDQGRDFIPEARTALGLSTDEPWPRLPRGRRVYLFHPGAWDTHLLVNLKERLP
ncbi:DUF3142 domain-containing protein [Holophaga foetida]|uniref:DUF3142 domain-containing protein n=1 Tax=Holophaga foetida TaxID=35839 RepID=UPI0002473756|nr:DUF3142 domain-containing protein [Holophaga foetida]